MLSATLPKCIASIHWGFLDSWLAIAEEHGGKRVPLGDSCPAEMTMWSVILQGPIHEQMNLGHWAFTDRSTADTAVRQMDQADPSRNTVLSKSS